MTVEVIRIRPNDESNVDILQTAHLIYDVDFIDLLFSVFDFYGCNSEGYFRINDKTYNICTLHGSQKVQIVPNYTFDWDILPIKSEMKFKLTKLGVNLVIQDAETKDDLMVIGYNGRITLKTKQDYKYDNIHQLEMWDMFSDRDL